MQKVIDLPHVRVLVVEPKNPNIYIGNYYVHDDTMMNHLAWHGGTGTDGKLHAGGYIVIPYGDFKLLGYYPGITEEQAAEVVLWRFSAALESLRSLLISNGLPVEGVRYAVLVEYK